MLPQKLRVARRQFDGLRQQQTLRRRIALTQATEHLLRFSVEHLVPRISPRPLFIAHGASNDLYSAAEAERLYELAGEPRELHLLEGAGHSEWMHDGHRTLQRLIDLITDFLARALVPTVVEATKSV